MCNLYNVTTNQQSIRDFIDITRFREGNLLPSISVHPDRQGPIVRVDQYGERELTMSKWGMPTPEVHLDGRPDKGVTNVRKTFIPHWQQLLGVENRCLVPATAFSEYEQVAIPTQVRSHCAGSSSTRLSHSSCLPAFTPSGWALAVPLRHREKASTISMRF